MNKHERSSLGGVAAAVIIRKKFVGLYYQNPNICKNCNKIIEIRDSEKPAETRRKRFCTHKCAGIYNNTHRVKKEKKVKEPKITRVINLDRPISEYFYGPQHKGSNKFSSICGHARCIAKKFLIKECKICGYINHVEVHHIKPISIFEESTSIGIVNSLDNLVYLCPNHHWEVENGKIIL